MLCGPEKRGYYEEVCLDLRPNYCKWIIEGAMGLQNVTLLGGGVN